MSRKDKEELEKQHLEGKDKEGDGWHSAEDRRGLSERHWREVPHGPPPPNVGPFPPHGPYSHHLPYQPFMMHPIRPGGRECILFF